MKITLPWPPTANSYFTERAIISKKTRRPVVLKFPSTKGQAYRKRVAEQVLLHKVRFGLQTHTGPLRMEIKAFPPDRRARDLDNLLKSLLDALTHCKVWNDDYQVRDLRIYDGGQIVKGGQVEVSIEVF